MPSRGSSQRSSPHQPATFHALWFPVTNGGFTGNINLKWDIAAGHALLVAAGGRIWRADDSGPVVYNKEDLVNPNFIAVRRAC